ncbi:MAG: hypothetical protein KDE31_16450, partial [Caldilineaceae bacterium]|nr:hypothetical protein [Caldilineaceae bacterium]
HNVVRLPQESAFGRGAWLSTAKPLGFAHPLAADQRFVVVIIQTTTSMRFYQCLVVIKSFSTSHVCPHQRLVVVEGLLPLRVAFCRRYMMVISASRCFTPTNQCLVVVVDKTLLDA